MRSLLLSLALGLVLFAPSQADATWRRWGAPTVMYYTPYYAPTYYPTTTYYYTPGTVYSPAPYYAPAAVYSPAPYYWSGNYYSTPYSAGWTYQRYYPYTNQYYYQYRGSPWGF